MSAPPARSSLIPVGSLAPSAFKTLLGQLLDYLYPLLGADGTPALAREAMNVALTNYLDNPDGAVYQRAAGAQGDDNYADDRWFVLTQTGTITPTQGTSPEDGYDRLLRLTQSQASVQRMGRAQIIPASRTRELRGQTVTFGGRYQLSTSANLRMALLAWTGAANVVTSDVVNSWTSGTYTPGNFFNSTTLTVVATSSQAMTGGVAANVSVSGAIPSGATNVIVFYWTEATVAQNVTLDAWGQRLVAASTLVDHIRRDFSEEVARCKRWCEAYAGPALYLVKVREADRERRVSMQFKVTKEAVPSAVSVTSSTADGGGAISATAGVDGVVFANLATADSQLPNVSGFIVSCDL